MMLENIELKNLPRLLLQDIIEFFDVLKGKESLKIFLANFPSFFKIRLRKGEKLKWNGVEFEIPHSFNLEISSVFIREIADILCGRYSIEECDIKEGEVVFDCGAHIGIFSYYALKKGASEVYAFEPNPYSYKNLKENIKNYNDKIKPIRLAVYSYEGEKTLFIPKRQEWVSATLLEKRNGTALEGNTYKEKIKVKLTTLDKFVEEKNIKKIDFIKIDAEGSEREIIKGAKLIIKKFKPKIAVSAYHLPDDKKVIPELILSINKDYKYKLANKGEECLFFY